MKQILVFPTWTLVKTAMPFLPKDHELKNKRITLKNWAKHSTDLNNAFSILFWAQGILITVFTIYLLNRI